MRIISRIILRLLGWQLDEQFPQSRRYVMIGYPHTSNWDFVLGMLAKWATATPLNWVAKHTIFRGPFRPLFIAMGGVPLNRQTTHGFIDRTVELFNQREQFILGLMPEGTRSKVERWKTGFYYIAHGAQVPIALAYLDYSKKRLGVGKVIETTGDIEADFEIIREFYKDKVGYRPEKQSELRIVSRQTEKGKHA